MARNKQALKGETLKGAAPEVKPKADEGGTPDKNAKPQGKVTVKEYKEKGEVTYLASNYLGLGLTLNVSGKRTLIHWKNGRYVTSNKEIIKQLNEKYERWITEHIPPLYEPLSEIEQRKLKSPILVPLPDGRTVEVTPAQLEKLVAAGAVVEKEK